MANLLEHFVGQEGRKGGRSFGAAAGAEPPQLAACRYQELVTAGPAFDAGETCFESTAFEILLDDVVNKTSPEAVASLEAILPESLDLVVEGLDEPVQGCLLGIAGAEKADRVALCGQGKPPSLSQRGRLVPAWRV